MSVAHCGLGCTIACATACGLTCVVTAGAGSAICGSFGMSSGATTGMVRFINL